MKRKILALVCAAVMVMGMSVTVLAAPSPSAGANQPSFTLKVGSTQTIDSSTLKYFANDTKVDGGVISTVGPNTTQDAINQAAAIYGNDAYIATIVDINVPNATFPYNLTIDCSQVWAGQTVTVLHRVDGVWERLTPSKVADNSVTVTVNSFSPFAVVVDSNPSPKTGDIALMVSALAGLFATGTVFTRKKR